jgi:hypothetical protein
MFMRSYKTLFSVSFSGLSAIHVIAPFLLPPAAPLPSSPHQWRGGGKRNRGGRDGRRPRAGGALPHRRRRACHPQAKPPPPPLAARENRKWDESVLGFQGRRSTSRFCCTEKGTQPSTVMDGQEGAVGGWW